MNKFEQVSSLGHHMSLAGGSLTMKSHVQGILYGEVPCPKVMGVPVGEVHGIMGNVHMGTPTCRQTDTTENITFCNFVDRR